MLGDMQDQPRLLDDLRHSAVPVVATWQGTSPLEFPTVDVDERAGIIAGLEHLIGLGHDRIAFVSGRLPGDNWQRQDAFIEFMASAFGGVPEGYVQSVDNSLAGGEAALRALFELDEPPTAVMTSTDLVAVGVLHAAYSMDRTVPDELSVVGFDDLLFAAHTVPALTTLRMPITEIVNESVELAIGFARDPGCRASRGSRSSSRRSWSGSRRPAGGRADRTRGRRGSGLTLGDGRLTPRAAVVDRSVVCRSIGIQTRIASTDRFAQREVGDGADLDRRRPRLASDAPSPATAATGGRHRQPDRRVGDVGARHRHGPDARFDLDLLELGHRPAGRPSRRSRRAARARAPRSRGPRRCAGPAGRTDRHVEVEDERVTGCQVRVAVGHASLGRDRRALAVRVACSDAGAAPAGHPQRQGPRLSRAPRSP